jgi:CubicO group peptidase (beta-lactamase class C family)
LTRARTTRHQIQLPRRSRFDEARLARSFVDDAPLARDAIFRIVSLTKPITAAATMSLVEEGLLRLKDPIDELVPELADRRVLRAPLRHRLGRRHRYHVALQPSQQGDAGLKILRHQGEP